MTAETKTRPHLGLREFLGLEWQAAETLSCGREDRVSYRRRSRWDAGLADSPGSFVAGDDVDFDAWRIRDANHRVVVKIALLHLAVLDCNFIVESRGEPEYHAALNL